jgi:hypothetical protein
MLLALIAAGCVGGSQPGGYDPTMPPATPPAMTLTSEGGAWEVSLWSFPDPPRKGLIDVVYRIADKSGSATDGLTVEAQPWMPAHGHGTSTVPTVRPQGAGLYWATPVNLYMSGRWELRTAIGDGSADRVVFVVDVP